MTEEHTETGGLRFGSSFWGAMNATWPFAKLRATSEGIEITLRGLISSDEHLSFKKQNIVALRKKRGLFSVGLEIEHTVMEHAPYILFWTLGFAKLQHKLEDLGFTIEK